MHDLPQEQFITLEEVRQLVRPKGKPIGPATIWRWVMAGCGPGRVRLQTWKVGGRRYTTCAAVAAFIAALNPGQSLAAASPAQRRRRSERAKKELETIGI